MLAWLSLVFVAVGLPQLAGWIDLASVWSSPWRADVAITLLTVVPLLGYLTVTEAGPARATWGKRRVGLAVDDPEGRVTVAQVLVRNTIKVLPWQLGHLAATRFATPGGTTGVAVVLFATSMLLLAAVILPPLVGRIGWHDRVAGTRVVAVQAPSEPAAVEEAGAAGVDLVQERLAQVEEELAAVVGDTSLCAISRSAGSVPAAKHLEGRAAALMALRRALRRGEQLPGPLTTLRHEWRGALEDVTARDAGVDWRAYRAGGVDELEELADRLAAQGS